MKFHKLLGVLTVSQLLPKALGRWLTSLSNYSLSSCHRAVTHSTSFHLAKLSNTPPFGGHASLPKMKDHAKKIVPAFMPEASLID
jgi:hypothetical protein